MIRLKRVYEPPAERDGVRVLVDALWPRGLKKEDAHIDEWLKSIAPSAGLRKWFGHDPARWEQFRQRYGQELADKTEEVRSLRHRAAQGTVTLLFAAKDAEHNNAVALKDYLARSK